MKKLVFILFAAFLASCSKSDDEGEVVPNTLNGDITILFNKPFYASGDSLILNIKRPENSSGGNYSIRSSDIAINFQNNSYELPYPKSRFSELIYNQGNKTIEFEESFKNYDVKSYSENVIVLPNNKIETVFNNIKYSDIKDEKLIITSYLNINKDFNGDITSKYSEVKKQQIEFIKGFYGVSYFYFNTSGSLDSVRIAYGNIVHDAEFNIGNAYNDIKAVYGEGQTTQGNNPEYAIKINYQDYIIQINQNLSIVYAVIKKKQY